MQPEIPENKRHPRFFISEQFITLRVDEVYFNVPTFILKKHSKKLEKLITDQKETDPECFAPLVQGISVVDLERFLATLFPTEYGQYDATSFDEWASILKVEFESIVKLALENIEPVSSPVDKVVLGKTYNIPEWATEARVLLCRREEPITLEEASRMGMEEVVNISQTRHHIRSTEIRSGMQDSTIRSLLSGEVDEEKLNGVAEITLPPNATQGAHSDSTAALDLSPVDGAHVTRTDPRICRALELRAQLNDLKSRLAVTRNVGWGRPKESLKEPEDLEVQIDDLEEEYLELYSGLQPERHNMICANSVYGATFNIERTSIAESCVLSKLTGCLHPHTGNLHTLEIKFPLFTTKCGNRKRPQKIALDVLDRHGLTYTTDATTGTITVPLASLN